MFFVKQQFRIEFFFPKPQIRRGGFTGASPVRYHGIGCIADGKSGFSDSQTKVHIFAIQKKIFVESGCFRYYPGRSDHCRPHHPGNVAAQTGKFFSGVSVTGVAVFDGLLGRAVRIHQACSGKAGFRVVVHVCQCRFQGVRGYRCIRVEEKDPLSGADFQRLVVGF